MPIILIGIAGSFFIVFTNPIYNDVSALNTEIVSYNEALDNSKMFENERDKLTSKYNLINPENLNKLNKLLPDNVDNIRLILEIEQIALPYGMTLKDVKYNVENTNTTTTEANETVIRGGSDIEKSKDYQAFDLEFSVSGTYDNFISFTRDIESNLRIVDISSIVFSSNKESAKDNIKTSSHEIYTYDFKIKTYYLKN